MATLRLRRSWTRWLRSRTARKLRKEERRLQLFLQMVDSQHLLLKQLEQRLNPLLTAPQELEHSQRFRETGVLSISPPEPATPTLSPEQEIAQLLGLPPR